MKDFEVTLGDAVFTVSLRSEVQDYSNTESNVPHFHIDHEVHIVLEGGATVELEGTTVRMKPSGVYVIPPNVSHYYRDCSRDFKKISFLFTLAKSHEHNGGFSEYDYYGRAIFSLKKHFSTGSAEMVRLAEQLLSLGINPSTEHVRKTLYAAAFIVLARLIEEETSEKVGPAFSESHSARDSYGQKKIIENFIHKRYSEGITIRDLSEALYKSVPQTHRIVKNYFNDNFKSILTRQRMEIACIMIREGRLPVHKIALSCGYSSYGGFLSAFKKYTGHSPEEYRKIAVSADCDAPLDDG